jgi:aminoglycoside phosphotransferase (APT) family kinase protein
MSTEEWHADIHVTETLVKDCLQQQFPKLTPIKAIKYIGEGWDNKVFLVNNKFVFRFPRRKASVALIEHENIILKNLPTFSGIAIPVLKYIGQASSIYPYPFQGYEIIPGLSGHQAHLAVEDRISSITTLALFLKQLHSINDIQASAIGIKPQGLDSRSNVAHVVTVLEERVAKIRSRGLCNIHKDYLDQEIIIAKKLVLSDDLCLVHGDLDFRHLIFNGKNLTGIIDWGDTDITNPAVDLEVIWSFYPPHCHSKFFEIYGEIKPDTWKYARFLGLYSAFSLMLYGVDLNDDLLVTEAINSIMRINPILIREL